MQGSQCVSRRVQWSIEPPYNCASHALKLRTLCCIPCNPHPYPYQRGPSLQHVRQSTGEKYLRLFPVSNRLVSGGRLDARKHGGGCLHGVSAWESNSSVRLQEQNACSEMPPFGLHSELVRAGEVSAPEFTMEDEASFACSSKMVQFTLIDHGSDVFFLIY